MGEGSRQVGAPGELYSSSSPRVPVGRERLWTKEWGTTLYGRFPLKDEESPPVAPWKAESGGAGQGDQLGAL